MKIPILILVILLVSSFCFADEMEKYTSDEYQFMINKPKDWIIVDDYHYKEVLDKCGSSGPDDRMICIFVKEKNPDLMPSINIGIQKQEYDTDYYFNNLEKLKGFFTKTGLSIVDGSKLVYLADRKTIYYSGKMIQPDSNKPFIGETYWFFIKEEFL